MLLLHFMFILFRVLLHVIIMQTVIMRKNKIYGLMALWHASNKLLSEEVRELRKLQEKYKHYHLKNWIFIVRINFTHFIQRVV